MYLKNNSLLSIASLLNEQGYHSKIYTTKSGKTIGGKKFGNTQIQWILKNIIYTGKVKYAGEIFEGEHAAIISDETFQKVQELLTQNHCTRKKDKNNKNPGLLNNLLSCKSCNRPMFYTYTQKKNKHKYYYYVCSTVYKHGYKKCPTGSLNAQVLEEVVINCLNEIFNNHEIPDKLRKTFTNTFSLWDTLFIQEKRRILQLLLKKISYSKETEKLLLTLNHEGIEKLCKEFDADTKISMENFKTEFEFKVNLKHHINTKKQIKKEPQVRQRLILAYQIQNLLDNNKAENFKQIAKWINMSPARISQITNLLLLCPAIQNELLFSENLNISESALQKIAAEIEWEKQMGMWKDFVAT